MWPQMVEIRVRRREGRIVARERAARRVCFCLRFNYELLVSV